MLWLNFGIGPPLARYIAMITVRSICEPFGVRVEYPPFRPPGRSRPDGLCTDCGRNPATTQRNARPFCRPCAREYDHEEPERFSMEFDERPRNPWV